jgi:hypothetical protein
MFRCASYSETHGINTTLFTVPRILHLTQTVSTPVTPRTFDDTRSWTSDRTQQCAYSQHNAPHQRFTVTLNISYSDATANATVNTYHRLRLVRLLTQKHVHCRQYPLCSSRGCAVRKQWPCPLKWPPNRRNTPCVRKRLPKVFFP